MVQNKHFKARIRERMAKTGESYTAARRHLLATLPAASVTPDGLLPGYLPQSSRTQRAARLWSSVLSQAGVVDPITGEPFSEAMLAGLAGGIGFMMFTFEYKETTTATVVTRFHPGPYVENLIIRSGAGIEQLATGSTTVASTRLEAALDTGVAVMVRVTPSRLRLEDTPPYEESADVVVAGRHSDSYLVDDGGGRVLPVRATDLAAARAGRKADRHWQAHSVEAASGTPAAHESNVRTAVRQTAVALLGTAGQVGISERFSKNFGVEGIGTWADRLRDTRTKKGWPALFAYATRRAPALTQIQEFLSGDEWSGPGALRPSYAEFLREAAAIDSLEALRDVAPLYDALGAGWDELADLIDPDCADEERTEHFAALAEKLDILAQGERSAAEALLAAAN
ncbi:DUF4872 domain-containing protein [Arthrobacter sp. H41]|uniref:DUF4872 domain-containing protein n=1 Tax=Arthrobacter sp. H41 TaxID=1312978 RepID=UPI00047C6961|nr:DUF4872 domain-containing protein [Arthrobacter sp. H41]